MLFTKYTNGTVAFSNRIAIAPMTRGRADHRDGIPNAMMAEYYRQRASAGLIISEGTPVSDRARGYLNTPALWNEDQAAGWKRVTDTIHREGGKVFVQLWHCGRISHSALHADGSPPAGPSAKAAKAKVTLIAADGKPVFADCETPGALTTAEVQQVVADFGRSAGLAKAAGFDGAEIHGANGYLLDQFRCPYLNDRNDQYGGALANRYRLLLEVVDAVAQVFAPARVCVRQSPLGRGNDMRPDPEPLITYPWLARELDQRGIGFLHIYDQSAAWIHDPADPLLAALRQAYGGGLIACGGFLHEKGEALLKRGHADIIAIGKPFISNPDLVARLQNGWPLAPWDEAAFYTGGEKGYLDYPVHG